jgi:hypothetical protein
MALKLKKGMFAQVTVPFGSRLSYDAFIFENLPANLRELILKRISKQLKNEMWQNCPFNFHQFNGVLRKTASI